MKARLYKQLDNKRLRRWLILFFMTIAVPSAVLVYQAYDQLKWEAFHLHSSLAEELTTRIDTRLLELIKDEEQRPFTAYSFLNVAGDKGGFLQRSPLSSFPIASDINGIIGYFQIDPLEQFSTPLLPANGSDLRGYGIDDREFEARREAQAKVYAILTQNKLIIASVNNKEKTVLSPAEKPALSEPKAVAEEQLQERDYSSSTLEAFDQLAAGAAVSTEQEKTPQKSLGKVEDLKLEKKYDAEEQSAKLKARKEVLLDKQAQQSSKRTEQNVLPEQRLRQQPQPATAPVDTPALDESAERMRTNDAVRIEIFESEVDPFEFAQLASGHFVLYRKVWRDKQRYIQGILINSDAFLQGIIEPSFRATSLSEMSNLAVAYNSDILSVIGSGPRSRYLSSAAELSGALLYRARLSAPLNNVELIYSINNLPAGPGGQVIIWSSVVLALVLLIGFLLLYRLGVGQINLARQQQDFVSAISHELKTPLTSIRMYGEMLREGWADETKKLTYYDYIFSESERLSRLINNILQLARMTRNDLHIDLKPYSMAQVIDTVRSKVCSQVERQGFEFQLDCDESLAQKHIQIDMDYLIQIIINLTDNAIKFSTKAERKCIEIKCQATNQNITIAVRDYGPGIAKDQLRKIFKLFYRTENELTRETVGTGIGLALVNQLTHAMGGSIDVVRHEPGVEFVLSFPCD